MAKSTIEPRVMNASLGEGGGALLRTALAMSAHTQQPIRLHSIRGAMRRTGLNAEDLAFLHALTVATAADVKGNDLDSDELTFIPKRRVRSVVARLDVATFQEGRVPGCSSILASAIAPILAKSGGYSSLNLFGETHANNALSFDAFEASTLKAWQRFGLYCFPILETSGFGFGTRGEMSLDIEPSAMESVEWLVRGNLVNAGIHITACDMSPTAIERAIASCRTYFAGLNIEPQIFSRTIHGPETGLAVTLTAEFENGFGSGSAVMQRGMQIPQVVEKAIAPFDQWIRSPHAVDPFLADQLVLPAVLSSGCTRFTTSAITRRLMTMVWVIKQFLPIRLTVLGREGEPGTVIVESSQN